MHVPGSGAYIRVLGGHVCILREDILVHIERDDILEAELLGFHHFDQFLGYPHRPVL